MKKSALIIGEFKKTETGFTGTLQTLAIKATITLHPNDDKAKDSHPDFIVQHGQNEIGVAWERKDDRGHYVSLSFEEPSLAAGYYTLAKSDKGISIYDLLYRKPMPKKGISHLGELQKCGSLKFFLTPDSRGLCFTGFHAKQPRLGYLQGH